MKRLLLIHKARPHFEVILALQSSLRSSHLLYLWSDSLQFFGRVQALSLIELSLHQTNNVYDLAIIISGDDLLTEEQFPTEIWKYIGSIPTLRIIHRFERPEKTDAIYLFSKANNHFLPISTGLEFLKNSDPPQFQKCRFLIQGNVEARRNYSLLSRIAVVAPDVDIMVCGIAVSPLIDELENVVKKFDLDELDFHKACSNSHFILPMIDPNGYRDYFENRFTSSIQIGFSYSLPFIAHRALFDLYPIVGLSYESDDEFLACIVEASKMSAQTYSRFVADIKARKVQIDIQNRRNIFVIFKNLSRSDEARLLKDAWCSDSDIWEWVRRETNSPLENGTSVEFAVSTMKSSGLNLHSDMPKNWDTFLALFHVLQNTHPLDTILDAGAERYSAFLPTLSILGFQNLYGINLVFGRPEKVDGVTYEHGDITQTRFPDQSLSYIACLSVIEHGVDIPAFLCDSARSLKKGGHLFISFDYWEDEVDTGGKYAFGVPIKILSSRDVSEILSIAATFGLSLKGGFQQIPKKVEKIIKWHGLDYTFFNLLLVKN